MSRKVFVSYAQVDDDAADEVVAALDAAGIGAWIDRREIRPGDSFIGRMNDGLAECEYLVVLLSAASLASRYVEMEWMSALASRDKVVIVVLNEPVTVPPILKHLLFIDLSKGRQAGLAELTRALTDERKPVLPVMRSSSTILEGASRY